MHPIKVLLRLVSSHVESVHAARVKAVRDASAALIRGGEIAVSRLGRSIATNTGVKHGIKRIDRLYGNEKLWNERHHFYRGLAHVALAAQASVRPVILIDWTEAGPSTCVLTAAVPAAGRALVIYSEAHPMAKYTNPKVEAEFLRRLRRNTRWKALASSCMRWVTLGTPTIACVGS